jgi:hypothetical protein
MIICITHLIFSIGKTFFEKIKFFYKTWLKVFGVEESESIVVFSKFSSYMKLVYSDRWHGSIGAPSTGSTGLPVHRSPVPPVLQCHRGYGAPFTGAPAPVHPYLRCSLLTCSRHCWSKNSLIDQKFLFIAEKICQFFTRKYKNSCYSSPLLYPKLMSNKIKQFLNKKKQAIKTTTKNIQSQNVLLFRPICNLIFQLVFQN